MAAAPLADEIRAVLAGTDSDVEIGGAGLAGQAFEFGLIEDVRVFRCPIALRGGTVFFPLASTDAPLELLGTRTFDPGVIFEHYRVSA